MLRKITFVVAVAGIVCLPHAHAAEPTVAPGQMDNFSLSGFCEKGKKNWDITGKSADIGSEVIKLNDVQSNLYGDNSTVHLTAQQGNFNRQLGQLHLEKDVVVTTSSGATLTTEQLNWDRKEQVVSTPVQVDIDKAQMHITAQGAHARTDLDTVDFQKDVRVRIEGVAEAQSAREPVTIRCDGPLQVDYAANTAVFNNNVDAVTRDCRIKSDTMQVLFRRSPKTNAGSGDIDGSKIERIAAKGNVKITRGDDVSYCEEAVYTASDRKICLSGRPQLVIYSAEDLNAPAGN
jgi:LPS export ABC transporter protein LptC